MFEIDYENIVQLHPLRKRTWAAYADDNVQEKFFLCELECWAVIEHIRKCEPGETPQLYAGETPCVRETRITPLFLDEMATSAYESLGDNFLGFTNAPYSKWTAEAEAYFAKRAGQP